MRQRHCMRQKTARTAAPPAAACADRLASGACSAQLMLHSEENLSTPASCNRGYAEESIHARFIVNMCRFRLVEQPKRQANEQRSRVLQLIWHTQGVCTYTWHHMMTNFLNREVCTHAWNKMNSTARPYSRVHRQGRMSKNQRKNPGVAKTYPHIPSTAAVVGFTVGVAPREVLVAHAVAQHAAAVERDGWVVVPAELALQHRSRSPHPERLSWLKHASPDECMQFTAH